MKKFLKSSIYIVIALLLAVSTIFTSFAIPSVINPTVYIEPNTYYIRDTDGDPLYWQHTWNYGQNPHFEDDPMYWMWAYNDEDDWDYDENGWTCYCLNPGLAATLGNGITFTSYGSDKWNELNNAQKSLIIGLLGFGYEGNWSAVKSYADCSNQETYMATQLAIWDVCIGDRSTNSFRLLTDYPAIYYANNCSCDTGELTVSGGHYSHLTKAYNYIWEHIYNSNNIKQNNGTYEIIPCNPTFSYSSKKDSVKNMKMLNYNFENSTFTGQLTSTNCPETKGCLNVYKNGSKPINLDNYKYERDYQGKKRISYITTSINKENSQKLDIKVTGDPISEDEPFTYSILSNETDTIIKNLKKSYEDSNGYVICTSVSDSDSFQNVIVAANSSYLKNTTAYISFYTDMPYGNLKIVKESLMDEFTDDNDCYSLKDAEYGIYSDEECENLIMSVKTDENGETVAENLKVGTYYIKEITPPKGYALDSIVYTQTVLADTTKYVLLKDPPQSDPIGVILNKHNATTQKYKLDIPLEGAQYEFCYYKGYYNSIEDLPEEYTRHYILKSDEYGECFLDPNHFVSGDDFYCFADLKIPVLPLGTLTIKEILAPKGFYLDTNTYIEHITSEGEDIIVNTYNAPISDEFEILNLSISGEKIWDDDNDRDGLRPKSVTIKLLRDGRLYKTAEVSEINNWKYEFTDIPEGCIDPNYEDYRRKYTYTIIEDEIDGYKSSVDEITFDKEDKRLGVCNITNKHNIEKTNVSGKKSWNDFENSLDKRPYNIKVNLYSNDDFVESKTVTKDDNWEYEFTNLPKYYDHGKEIKYTVTENAVKEYTASYDGMNIENTLVTGSVTLYKLGGNNESLQNVGFKLFTSDNKEVSAILQNKEYHFTGLENKNTIFFTNEDGLILIKDLPCGTYYFKETNPLENYMPYEKNIEFTIEDIDNDSLNKKVTVKDNKVLMYNTGSIGNIITYIVAGIILIFALIALFFYKKSGKKTNKKEINNNMKEKKS